MRTCLLAIVAVTAMCSHLEAFEEEFHSAEARNAEKKFLAAVKAARDVYISDLEEAAKTTLKADNLDEAVRIKEKIRDLKSQQQFDRGDPVVQLRRKLKNTTWKLIRDKDPKNAETMRFLPGNRVTKVYGSRSGTGIWESIEKNVVVAKFNEKLLIFQFDDKLSSFKVVAFGPTQTAYTSGKKHR